MRRKICVVTGGRSDYGLLKWLMKAIQADNNLELQVIATGMHLSPKFGSTVNEIEQDGYKVDEKVDCLDGGDSAIDVTNAMAKTMIGCAEAYSKLKPDVVLILGDRFEIFSAAAAALLAKIPIAHLHGGEVTSGAIDESFRHAITKMSALHFVANEEYQRRVLQMGENPNYVYNVGGLGVDAMLNFDLLSKEQLASELGINFLSKSLLVTFHPETATSTAPEFQITEIINALAGLNDTTLIFTMPNADTGNSIVTEIIQQFVNENENRYFFESLGQTRYLSTLKIVDGVVGNSSSGLAEAPSFKIGTINIGDRQNGRIQASSVLNCEAFQSHIVRAIEEIYSDGFQSSLKTAVNPYGTGGASQRIVEILKEVKLEGLIMKSFNDL
jgi:GDP/UDP-N,N'-diacetylbacillosamine 2-epimerase (hydrolysing)